MKAHIGVDSDSRLTRSLETTPGGNAAVLDARSHSALASMMPPGE